MSETELPHEVRLLRAIWARGCGMGLNCTDELFVQYGFAELTNSEEGPIPGVPEHTYSLTELGRRVLRADEPATQPPDAG